MTWLSDPDAWSALATLLALEIVLGVDNEIFISILASKLPAEQQGKVRRIGLLAAGGQQKDNVVRRIVSPAKNWQNCVRSPRRKCRGSRRVWLPGFVLCSAEPAHSAQEFLRLAGNARESWGMVSPMFLCLSCIKPFIYWRSRQESNLQPTDYKSVALSN